MFLLFYAYTDIYKIKKHKTIINSQLSQFYFIYLYIFYINIFFYKLKPEQLIQTSLPRSSRDQIESPLFN